MKVYTRTISYENAGDRIKLVCFGCVHGGAANCDMDGFQQMLKRHGKVKDTYLVDMGDACDCVLPKDSTRFRSSCLHPYFREKDEDIVDQQVDWYCEQHEKYTDLDKFLGIVSGNHHDAILKYHSTDPTKRIAKRLGIPNLGYTFYYRLLFKKEGTGYQELIIYGHHGWGGGTRTEGGNLTKYAKNTGHYLADIYLYGHTHDKWSKRIIRVKPVLDRVQEVPMIVANTGTFLRTLTKDEVPSYSERAGYPPRDLGYVIIEITTPTEEKPYFDLRGLV